MKKILGLFLCFVLIFSAIALVGCDTASDPANTDKTPSASDTENSAAKLGLGIYTNEVAATNANEDKNGAGSASMTVAAVLVDANGKIVKAYLDCAAVEVKYTAEGEALANASFQTKNELKEAYNMKTYGGAAKEWFEQAAIFSNLVVGKTVNEVKALVANGSNKGTDAVINAGCTIKVAEFVNAIEKAVANATITGASATDTLKVGVSTSQTTSDAIEDKDGYNQTETTFFAAAVNAEGKVVAASSDCVQIKFTFDAAGASKFDATKAISSKKEAGANYGMKAYGGAAKEWFEQAAAFDSACVGKTVAQIAELKGADNKGVASLQSAGCTILVDGFTKAAAKIA